MTMSIQQLKHDMLDRIAADTLHLKRDTLLIVGVHTSADEMSALHFLINYGYVLRVHTKTDDALCITSAGRRYMEIIL